MSSFNCFFWAAVITFNAYFTGGFDFFWGLVYFGAAFFGGGGGGGTISFWGIGTWVFVRSLLVNFYISVVIAYISDPFGL